MPSKEAFIRARDPSDMGLSEHRQKPVELIIAGAWATLNGAYEHLGKHIIVIQHARELESKGALMFSAADDMEMAVDLIVSILLQSKYMKKSDDRTKQFLPLIAHMAIGEYVSDKCRTCHGARMVRTEMDVTIECPKCGGSGKHRYGTRERLDTFTLAAGRDATSIYTRLERPLTDAAGIIGFAVRVQHEAAVKRLGRE